MQKGITSLARCKAKYLWREEKVKTLTGLGWLSPVQLSVKAAVA
jgi:hypothetical protein